MVASRRWDMETLIDIGLPPVPEEAPVRFKGRYSGLVQALGNGRCPECLVDLVVVPEPSRPWNVTMEHVDGCPYSAPSMRSLVDELGLAPQIDPGPPALAVERDLFEAIVDLEFDPYL